jgi:hypothetical protein
MMAIDTLAYTKALEAAGVERPVAEAHAEALIHALSAEIATKSDIAPLASKADLGVVRADLAQLATKSDMFATKAELADLKADLAQLATKSDSFATKAELAELKYELTWRVFGIVLAVVGIADGIMFALLRGH